MVLRRFSGSTVIRCVQVFETSAETIFYGIGVLRIASADLSNKWSQWDIFSTVKRALQIASAGFFKLVKLGGDIFYGENSTTNRVCRFFK